ncbi:hypothetical protein SEA_MADAMATO_60 [Streptomyces phage Madamato]|nr:hypothetical protein SEA_MADAMATO_60 [Streptomyces phage Madamato]
MIELFTKLLWAAIGAAAGYYVAKSQLHGYYEERLKKEVEDAQYFFKEKYDAKLKNLKGEEDVVPDKWDESHEEHEEEKADEYSEGLLSDEAAEALTNYQGISAAPSVLAQELIRAESNLKAVEALTAPGVREKVMEAVTIENEAQEAEEVDIAARMNAGEGPRLINFTMYDENEPNYAQTTVTYFAKGGDVADEQDEKLEADTIEKHIGGYNLEQLNENRPTIYVRNDQFRMDFEIVWDRDSYDVSVLGKKG